MKNKKKIKKPHTTTQIIAFGFLCAIIIGTVLLILPVASKEGVWTNPLDALFTATTSVCVTGLVVVNTYAYWSIFGKVVILLLIQCGGLGIVAFTTIFMVAIGKKVTLRDRLLLVDAFNLNSLSGLVKFLKRIFYGTFLVELVGAILYMPVFVPEFGARGIFISIFTSVSAFCNAGIDIIGDSSLMPYVSSVIINFVTMILIILGGIGFIVWWDLIRVINMVRNKSIKKTSFWNRLNLHTKIILITTFILIFGGAFLILVLEWNNPETIGNLAWYDKLMAALFQSVTTRTAGFATISQKGLHETSAFICMLLMFIGGSSVGTAGGIKTGTVAVVAITAISVIQGRDDVTVYGRTIPLNNVRKALAVMGVSISLSFAAIIFLTGITGINFVDGAYETISAIGTAGLTRNTTPLLNVPGKIIIIICMYFGRIGPISMAIAMTRKDNKKSKIIYPEEEITVG